MHPPADKNAQQTPHGGVASARRTDVLSSTMRLALRVCWPFYIKTVDRSLPRSCAGLPARISLLALPCSIDLRQVARPARRDHDISTTEDDMSYQWIDDQSQLRTPRDTLSDRRTDRQTAEKIRDALRARSVHAAAQALQHQEVDLATALRVLAKPEWRRAPES
jgi:hypothetical protein